MPRELPVRADDGWVLVSGYTPNPDARPPYEAWLCLGGKVPEVAGLPLDEALDAVVAHGLVPRARSVDGRAVAPVEGWEVVTTDPLADTLLPFEDVVVVTAASPTTTPTPELPSGSGGGTETDSRSGDSGAEAQPPQQAEGDAPAAGPPATTTDADDVAPAATGRPLWPLLLILVALVGAVITAALVRRAHRKQRREPHVVARARDAVPQTELTELRGLGRSHTVRVETHRDDEEATLRAAPSAGPAIADPQTVDPTADGAEKG